MVILMIEDVQGSLKPILWLILCVKSTSQTFML